MGKIIVLSRSPIASKCNWKMVWSINQIKYTSKTKWCVPVISPSFLIMTLYEYLPVIYIFLCVHISWENVSDCQFYCILPWCKCKINWIGIISELFLWKMLFIQTSFCLNHIWTRQTYCSRMEILDQRNTCYSATCKSHRAKF